MKVLILSILTTSMSIADANAKPIEQPYRACADDLVEYQKRSEELQKLAEADQADRPNNTLKPGAQIRDRQRRARVGSIFGEGCFKDSKDYAAAATVFQHGDQPDHFMQTFLWAKRAFELGDDSQKTWMAWGIDRYLVKSGRKQFFGSQFLKNNANDSKSCWCLEQTEMSFPDELRLKFTGHTYQQQLDALNVLNAGLACPKAECSEIRIPSPKGTVPGFF